MGLIIYFINKKDTMAPIAHENIPQNIQQHILECLGSGKELRAIDIWCDNCDLYNENNTLFAIPITYASYCLKMMCQKGLISRKTVQGIRGFPSTFFFKSLVKN